MYFKYIFHLKSYGENLDIKTYNVIMGCNFAFDVNTT